MKALIEKSKYLILIAVVTLLVTFALAIFWGVVSAIRAWVDIVASAGQSAEITLSLIKLIDVFLLVIVLYLLAASIYKLFIGDVALPERLVAHNLPELKSKLSGIIVLVIAVHFVEYLFDEHVAPLDLFWLAAATALVSAALIAFDYISHSKEPEEEARDDLIG
jgi:uncharacterized membrane protein YqhA